MTKPAQSRVAVGLVTGKQIAMNPAAVEAAIAAAAASAESVRRLTSFARARILDRVAAGLDSAKQNLAEAMADESGYLTVHDMVLEVERAVEVFTLTAAYCRVGLDEVINLEAVERGRNTIGLVRRRPIGPILGITAFNGPILIAAHKIAPAIAAGAPIVIKPAPRIPHAAILLAEHIGRAGWPSGAVAVLPVDNNVTIALIRDERLPVISFTGGDFGWAIKDMVPRKRVHLELGGVGAVIVAADADLAAAADQCAVGGVVRSGQSCISVQRIYVERPTYRAFVDLLAERMGRLVAGDVADPKTAVGPLVDEAAAKRVESMVVDAVKKGARLVCGGHRVGTLMEPTLIADATDEMAILRREAFGPVIAVAPVDDLGKAVSEANATGGAIHVGLFTSDIDTALGLADELVAGGVIINGANTWRVDQMPYGGVGSSGFGREGIRYMINEYTEPKIVVLRHNC